MPTRKTTKASKSSFQTLFTNREGFIALIFFSLIIIILFGKVLFTHQDFLKPDTIAARYTTEGLKKLEQFYGEYPFWNPFIFSGMPSYEAMSYHKYVYLPSFIFLLFQAMGIKSTVFMILHYLLAAMGVYFLLRYWKFDLYIALLGALAFAFTPYLIVMLTFGHGSQMMTASYIPLIFYFTIRLFDTGRLRDAAFLALLVGVQLQRAHIQIAYYTWMLMGAYFIYSFVLSIKNRDSKRNFWQRTLYFLVALLVGFGLSMVLYLPVAEYAQYSIRGGKGGGTGFDYATAWSFHPAEILTFLVPSWFGFGGQTYWGYMPFTDFPNYMGLLILTLAFLAPLLNRKPIVYFLSIIAILALLISFGKYFFLYKLLYSILPYFNKFRVPSMILIMLQFSVALLAAFGLHGLLELIQQKKVAKIGNQEILKWLYIIWGILLVIILYITIFESSFRNSMYSHFASHVSSAAYANRLAEQRFSLLYQDLWLAIIIMGSGSLLLFALMKEKISGTTFLITILLLTAVDLYRIDLKLTTSESSSRLKRLLGPDGVTQILEKDKEKFRIYPLGKLFNEKRWAASGLESIGGYHPAKLQIYQSFMEQTGFQSAGILQMLNVKYILSTRKFNDPRFSEVTSSYTNLLQGTIPVVVYRFDDYLPRVFFSRKVIALPDRELIYKKLKQPEFNPLQVAYVLNSDLKVKPPALLDTTGTISDFVWSPNSISFTTTTRDSAFLVLSEVYYPGGWQVTLDNQPAEIIETNALLRGIFIPEGTHKVRFFYSNRWIKMGLAITLFSYLILLAILGYLYLWPRFKKGKVIS